MTFIILGLDGPDGQARRKVHRPAHLARLEKLDAQGRLILAGTLTDGTGSLIVIEVDSREEAEAFIREDPYVLYRVFERYEIHPLLQVFPKKPAGG
ncbi:YciI family protein [Nitrospira sp. Kam-Ns4a]